MKSGGVSIAEDHVTGVGLGNAVDSEHWSWKGPRASADLNIEVLGTPLPACGP